MTLFINPFVKTMAHLAQLDIDEVLSYDQALENIQDEELRKNLTSFRDDHKRHVANLSQLIHAYHGEPPNFTLDAKGFVIEGMTAIMSKVGTHAALMALIGNESLSHALYGNALKQNLPFEVRQVIEMHQMDEEHHLATIRKIVAERYEKPHREDGPAFPKAI